MVIGDKGKINGVDIAYSLSWDTKMAGKCCVEVITPQGKLFGNGDKSLDGCVALAAYACKEFENAIVLWEIDGSGKWIIIGVSDGILAPGSDRIINDDEVIEAVDEMKEFVDGETYVIGDGVPHVSFDNYDASNIEEGQKLVAKKVNLKMIGVVFLVLLAGAGKYGYDMYQEEQARIVQEQAAIAAAAAEAERKRKLEADIVSLSGYETPLNYDNVVSSMFSVQKSYDGWVLKTFEYPSKVAVFEKQKYAYLDSLVTLFGNNVAWTKDGTKAEVKFDISLPDAYSFSNEDMYFMDKNVGTVYDVSLLQRLNNLGFSAAFKEEPPVWAGFLPDYPEKYYRFFMLVTGNTSDLHNVLKVFDKFGMIVGKILIEQDKGVFSLELAHYMLVTGL